MEAVEEPPIQITAAEADKVNTDIGEDSVENVTLAQSEECQKSNGVLETNDCNEQQPLIEECSVPDHVESSDDVINEEKNTATNDVHPEPPFENSEISATDVNIKEIITEDGKQCEPPINDESEELKPGDVEVDGIIEAHTENILFETEILVESNVDEPSTNYKIIYSDNDETDNTNNILCELGQNIELSEVMRSDVTDNVENNNSEVRQEVFNKEELLDILEGNDAEESRKVISQNFQSECKKFESELALRQLTRLQNSRKAKTKKIDKRNTRKSEPSKIETEKKPQKVNTVKKENSVKNEKTLNNDHETDNSQGSIEKKEESIVNALVKDWEDDDGGESEQPSNATVESDNVSQEITETQQNATVEGKEAESGDVNTPNSNAQNNESLPQRRLGRVIKKKVIFDPDNPDTFTKTKVTIKKENSEKEPSIQKKIKVDPTSPSKSLVQTKLQWKKPQPKNNKKYSRPTEIDKLLMDEGAVNMICQLTPEAPKGHKNMKSKAEYIKKLQSSTPNSKEMKFRERKKELKTEDNEARKIAGFKDRLSLSSSVKSPAASEDFEAHSADDSIIYRRHSSSSYSSSCMSPRRLSDVDSINQSAISSQTLTPQNQKQKDTSAVGTDVFMSENEVTPQTGVINKNNLLSIKEKLNSKLSLALNKRKRESNKGEKPPKIKKVPKLADKPEDVYVELADFSYLTLKKDMKLVEICILNSGAIYNIEVIKELIAALEYVDSIEDVSVTLLTSESGSLCSGLHMKPLLDQQTGSTYGRNLAESVRSLLCTLMAHNKLICSAVGDKCQGLGLSMIALSDITFASESASFGLTANKDNPLQPCATALITGSVPPYLLRDLIVFERCISAAEALRGGLVSRLVWPNNYIDQVRAIAKDIAAQPKQNVLLKKQLLRLQRGASGSFLSDLEKERDLFVQYWTSAEGRDVVCASLAGP